MILVRIAATRQGLSRLILCSPEFWGHHTKSTILQAAQPACAAPYEGCAPISCILLASMVPSSSPLRSAPLHPPARRSAACPPPLPPSASSAAAPCRFRVEQPVELAAARAHAPGHLARADAPLDHGLLDPPRQHPLDDIAVVPSSMPSSSRKPAKEEPILPSTSPVMLRSPACACARALSRSRSRGADSSGPLSCARVDAGYAQALEALDVARSDSEPMGGRDGGDLRVVVRRDRAIALPLTHESAPAQAGIEIERQDRERWDDDLVQMMLLLASLGIVG